MLDAGHDSLPGCRCCCAGGWCWMGVEWCWLLLLTESVRRGAASNGQWDAITCNPADNIGPILSPHHEWTGWQHTIGDIVAGNDFPQTNAYRPWQVVDVRDCAAAHIALLESVTVRCTASQAKQCVDQPQSVGHRSKRRGRQPLNLARASCGSICRCRTASATSPGARTRSTSRLTSQQPSRGSFRTLRRHWPPPTTCRRDRRTAVSSQLLGCQEIWLEAGRTERVWAGQRRSSARSGRRWTCGTTGSSSRRRRAPPAR